MIFATVGTAPFQFNRFIALFDDLYQIDPSLDVVIQTGTSSNKHKGLFKCVEFLDHSDYLELIDSSDLIIAHCGIGVTIDAEKFSKKLILVPRDPGLGEHTDKHQFELAKAFYDYGRANVLYPEHDVEYLLKLINSKPLTPKSMPNNFLNKEHLLLSLEKYLGDMY
jgi:UDP-N-acetylglucosamine transferase subunit ALG13